MKFICINGKICRQIKEGRSMFKKVFGILAALAVVFGTASQTNFAKNISDTCSYVCCEHDGDLWSN